MHTHTHTQTNQNRRGKEENLTAIKDWLSQYNVEAEFRIRLVTPSAREAELDAIGGFGGVSDDLGFFLSKFWGTILEEDEDFYLF